MTESLPPEAVLVHVPELEQLFTDTQILTDRDKIEMVTQLFDHFLNANRLSIVGFRLNIAMLSLWYHEIQGNGKPPQELAVLSHNVAVVIYKRLQALGFEHHAQEQGGWYYVLKQLRPGGRLLLRNISPKICNTQNRYDPALYP